MTTCPINGLATAMNYASEIDDIANLATKLAEVSIEFTMYVAISGTGKLALYVDDKHVTNSPNGEDIDRVAIKPVWAFTEIDAVQFAEIRDRSDKIRIRQRVASVIVGLFINDSIPTLSTSLSSGNYHSAAAFRVKRGTAFNAVSCSIESSVLVASLNCY